MRQVRVLALVAATATAIGLLGNPPTAAAVTAAPVWSATGSDLQGADAVSCSNGGTCSVLGTVGGSLALAIYSNGSWSDSVAPSVGSDLSVQPEGLACPTVNECVAVGGVRPPGPGNPQPVIDTYSHGAWQSIVGPGSGFLDGVTCPTANICFAAGFANSPGGETSPLFESLQNGKWTVDSSTQPANSMGVAPIGVICQTRSRCFGFGSGTDAYGTSYPALWTLAAGGWDGKLAPVPVANLRAETRLSAGSCTHDGCTIIGSFPGYGNVGSGRGFTETESNGQWKVAAAAFPAGAKKGKGAGLNAVACVSGKTCEAAVGHVRGANDTMQGLLETSTGGKLKASFAPLPMDASATPSAALNAVACQAGPICSAVGGFSDKAGDKQAMIDNLLKGRWRSMLAPLPPDAQTDSAHRSGPQLSGIACSAAGPCVAYGTYETAATDDATLLEASSGAS